MAGFIELDVQLAYNKNNKRERFLDGIDTLEPYLNDEDYYKLWSKIHPFIFIGFNIESVQAYSDYTISVGNTVFNTKLKATVIKRKLKAAGAVIK